MPGRIGFHADRYNSVAGDPEDRHGIVVEKNGIAKGHGVKTPDTSTSPFPVMQRNIP